MGKSIYKRVIVFTIFAGLLSLAFNNCAKSNLAGNGSADQSSEEPEDLTSTPLCKISAKTKALETENNRKLPADMRAEMHQTSDKMLVLTDTECLKKNGSKTWLSQKALNSIQNRQTPSSTFNATAIEIGTTVTGDSLEALANSDPCVVKVDVNAPMTLNALPNDAYFSQNKQTYLPAINFNGSVEKMYNSANGINQTIRIAVLDSGIDANHPDLQALMLRDSSGKLIALNGFDNGTDVIDSGFHGTHVAGLIAAQANNGVGITGVMGQNVRIMPVKVSNDGSSVDMAAVINGLYWAADNGANIANLSLGGPTDRPALKEALQYAASKGVFVVVASGNNGKVLGTAQMQYPAMYGKDIDGMITVGSFDATSKAISSFSNISSSYVDIMAPGSDGTVGILSTFPANVTSGIILNGGGSYTAGTGYAQAIRKTSTSASPIHGTSMATPVAAGVAAAAMALAKSRGYMAPPDQIESLFSVGSDSVSAYNAAAKGGKSLNLTKMLGAVDTDTSLSISSGTSRSAAKGNLQIALQPVGATLPLGTVYEMSVGKSASSSILVDYQWYKNGVAMANQRTAKLKISSATAQDKGDYYVQLKAGTTIVKSQTASIKIDGSGCP